MAWLKLRRKKREAAADDGSMSLMEHLYELRRRLGWAFAFIFIGIVIGFIWFDHGIHALGIKPLGQILINPYYVAKHCQIDSVTGKLIDNGVTECKLLSLTPFAGLALQLKAALMAGLVFSSPGWLYQIWAFVTPALYSKERKYAVSFVSAAAVLFALGAFLAYLVIGEGLTVLFGFAENDVEYILGPAEYYSFLMTLLIVFGLSFELPLFLIVLNFIGVVKGRQLVKWRRYAIFAMFVFAALVVPGNDPITMLALALSLSVLYEISTQVARFNDRRKGRNHPEEEELKNLADDEASAI